MTTEDKFSEIETLGYCPVRTCPFNFNFCATCDDYTKGHCFKKLYHQVTDAKMITGYIDDDNNEVIERNPVAFGEKPLELLEPWVKKSDIPKFHYDATLIRLKFCMG